MFVNTRALINAPCKMIYEDDHGKVKTEYPAVDCSEDCKHCGWNPKEAERRMTTGKIVEKSGIKTLYFKRS